MGADHCILHVRSAEYICLLLPVMSAFHHDANFGGAFLVGDLVGTFAVREFGSDVEAGVLSRAVYAEVCVSSNVLE